MLSKRLRELIAPMSRNLRIMWLAFAFGCLLYLLLGFMIEQSRPPGPEETSTRSTTLPAILMVAALGVWAISIVIPRRSLADASLGNAMDTGRTPTAAELGGDGDTITRRLGELTDAERRILPVVTVTVHVQVITWAALEAIALFGLFLFLVGYPLAWMVPFVAVAFLLILTRPPNLAGVLDRAQRVARR